MWLRDTVAKKLSPARVWIYGFDSRIHRSESVQTIDDLGRGFAEAIEQVADPSTRPLNSSSRPRSLVLIGHSLGGLIIKQVSIVERLLDTS